MHTLLLPYPITGAWVIFIDGKEWILPSGSFHCKIIMPWRIQFLHESNNITNICNYYIIQKESSVWFRQEKKTCKSVWQLCRYRVSRLGLCPGRFLCRELIDSTELICCHAQETSGCGLTVVGQVCYYNIMRGLSTLGLIERWHFSSEILSI